MNSKMDGLSRRERQIMEVIYSRGEATVTEVREGLVDAPGYSAVRALLRILVEKGVLTHRADGPRYVYSPTVIKKKASRSVLKNVIHTFFNGSLADAVSALVDSSDSKLSDDEIKRLEDVIKKAKQG